MFGASLTLVVGGANRPAGDTQQDRWLLGLLALRAGNPGMDGNGWVEREVLASHLWEESPRERRLAQLRNALPKLREALDEKKPAHRDQPRRLLTDGTRVRLDLSGADVDVFHFDVLAAPLRYASTAAGFSLDDARRLVQLYAGPLLDGCRLPFAVEERAWREAAYLRALRLLRADATVRRDDVTAHAYETRILAALRQALARDPFSQPAARALLTALRERGDVPAFRRTLKRLQERCSEYCVPLEPETRLLFEQARQIPGSAAGDTHTSAPTRIRGLPILPQPHHNLPDLVSMPPLVGRRAQIALAQAQLRTERIVTVTGCGGIGKTRLALQVAHVSTATFEDGVWWVELASAQGPGDVAEQIRRALPLSGAGDHSTAPPLALAKAFLRTRETLLILDNCEHLRDGLAGIIEGLLGDCPRLSILVTSREPVTSGSFGGAVNVLPPLSLIPDKAEDTRENTAPRRSESALLLLQRLAGSGSVPGGWKSLSPAEREAIDTICRRMDGIPLALELVAGRIESAQNLPPVAAQLDSALDNWLSLLSGPETAQGVVPPGRHHTMEACLHWSYDRLARPGEKALLRALAVFEDGATREAIEAVCAEGASALGGLVRRSLLREENLPDQPTRFRLLEPVRQFARRRLAEAGEEEIVVRRHRDYYLQLTENWERDLVDDRSRPAIEKALRRETGNLRAALLACAEDIVGTAPRLWRAPGAWRQLFHRDFGESEEGHRWLARLLDTADSTVSPQSAARALLLVGRFMIASPAYPLARGVFEAALAIAREARDTAAIAELELMLGHLATDLRDWGTARPHCEESRRLYADLGDTTNEARALSYLCDIVLQEQDIPAARALAQQLFDTAHAIAEPSEKSEISPQDRDQLATARYRLGRVAEAEHCWKVAARNYSESLCLYEALGNRAACLVIVNSLGRVRAGEGALEESVYLFGATDAWGKRVHSNEKYPEEHQTFVATVRSRMERVTFQAAWEEGRAAEWTPLIQRAATFRPTNDRVSGPGCDSSTIRESSPPTTHSGAPRRCAGGTR